MGEKCSARRSALVAALLGAVLLLVWPAPPGLAQTANATVDAAAVAAFVDEFLAKRMPEEGVPGAAVAVVRDGQMLFSKGYGLADVAGQRPVDPETTLFRVASVSKALAFTAVLQLAEQGKIDLQADVNRYLNGYQIPQRFDRPVTVHHLLTHTDGLAERNLGIFALTPDGLKPTAAIMAAMEPPFAPPGQMITYGSWGSALAGYLVEEVSGRTLAEYARDSLFTPLGMRSTTFEQVLPPAMQERVATIYTGVENFYSPSPYLYITTPATGGLTTTANDMAKFMEALLDGGGPVLQPESVRSMFETQFAPLPGFPGVTYGFMEHLENGRKLLIREGSGLGAGSAVVLLPEEGLGLFYAQNSKGTDLAMELLSAFLDRFYPDTAPPPAAGAAGAASSDVSGTYRYVQHSRTTFTKLQALVAGMVSVKRMSDGSLQIGPVGMGDIYGGLDTPGRFERVAPMVYRNPATDALVAFRTDESGTLQMVSGRGYHGTFARAPWYLQMEVQLAALLVSAVLMLAALVRWLLTRHDRDSEPVPLGWGRALAAGAGAANLLFLAAVYPVLFVLGSAAGFPAYTFQGGTGPTTVLLFLLPVAGLCLGVAGLAALARSRRLGSPGARLQLTLATAANLAFTVVLWQWNLLGLNW